jgi:hypothetical protein
MSITKQIKTLLLFSQIITLLSFFSLTGVTTSFKTTGHFLVARIAEKRIESENPAIHDILLNFLSITGEYTKDENYPFIESASWADDIKYIGWDTMNPWHFHNIYIDGKRIIPVREYASLGLHREKTNIVWAINEIKGSLRNTRISEADDRLGKSINLRMLIHLIGDIHQPLHASTLVNEDFPKGDAGGNAFEINMRGYSDLHSYWDSCLKKYPIMKHPLSEKQFNKLENFVTEIENKHPYNSPNIQQRLKKTSVNDWAYESVKLSINYAYKGISPGQAPSPSYISRGQNIIDEQLAVAGYRLADTLIEIFSDPDASKIHLKGYRPAGKVDMLRMAKDSVSSQDFEIKEKVSRFMGHDSQSVGSLRFSLLVVCLWVVALVY